MSKAKLLFEEDLKDIAPLSDDEFRSLFQKAKSSDESAFSELIERSMHRVYHAALLFGADDSVFMDLVQEGNLQMISFLESTDSWDDEADEALENEIRDAMERFLREEEENKAVGEELKTKLNVIDQITMKIAEEENREATAEEIAKLMGLTESDVKYLMRIALSALEEAPK